MNVVEFILVALYATPEFVSTHFNSNLYSQFRFDFKSNSIELFVIFLIIVFNLS